MGGSASGAAFKKRGRLFLMSLWAAQASLLNSACLFSGLLFFSFHGLHSLKDDGPEIALIACPNPLCPISVLTIRRMII